MIHAPDFGVVVETGDVAKGLEDGVEALVGPAAHRGTCGREAGAHGVELLVGRGDERQDGERVLLLGVAKGRPCVTKGRPRAAACARQCKTDRAAGVRQGELLGLCESLL